jgi:anaerobic magnesium-protoporphyrin IX monomethyl ester cyclase
VKIVFLAESITLEQEPLGLMLLAATLKNGGHSCFLIHLDKSQGWIEAVERIAPRVVAFSTPTGLHKQYIQASLTLKKRLDFLSIFGGPHPSFFPEMIYEEGVDIICMGEGEFPFLELVDSLESGTEYFGIANLWVKQKGEIRKNPTRPFIQNLDVLPFPDRDLLSPIHHLSQSDTRYFMAGRGCPYNCSFCFNQAARKLASGTYIRWRSVDNIFREIRKVREEYPFRVVNFQDDTFILNRNWLDTFAVRYPREIGMPFFCHVRANLLSERVCSQLAEAGCIHVGIGLESGNDFLRNQILRKRISKQAILTACNTLHRHGIRITTQNMFGIPHETVETVLETIDLNIQCQPDRSNLYYFTPYPKTAIADYTIVRGFFEPSQFDSLPDSFVTEKAHLTLDLPRKKEIEALAPLTRFCVHFPAFFPIIRFLFRLRGFVLVKSLISKILLSFQASYSRIVKKNTKFE